MLLAGTVNINHCRPCVTIPPGENRKLGPESSSVAPIVWTIRPIHPTDGDSGVPGSWNNACGLLDEPRSGRPRAVTDDDVERVIMLTLETTPRDATHWSTRSM